MCISGEDPKRKFIPLHPSKYGTSKNPIFVKMSRTTCIPVLYVRTDIHSKTQIRFIFTESGEIRQSFLHNRIVTNKESESCP